MENSIIISVNSIKERDKIVKKLYTSLSKSAGAKFTIQKDRINRIKIYHNKKNTQILVSTYIVIILPVLLDLSPIESITGTAEFRLDETIVRLETLARKLRGLQGKKVIRKKAGTKELNNALINLF